MRNTTPVQIMDCYPDLLGCFQGRSNCRQREEYRKFLYRAIKTQLTQRQTQLIVMRYFRSMSISEISEELHLNKSTVSRTFNRALDRLTDLARLYFHLEK